MSVFEADLNDGKGNISIEVPEEYSDTPEKA